MLRFLFVEALFKILLTVIPLRQAFIYMYLLIHLVLQVNLIVIKPIYKAIGRVLLVDGVDKLLSRFGMLFEKKFQIRGFKLKLMRGLRLGF